MKTKTMLPVMLLMGTVALGVGQDIQQPATLQVIDGLTTQISVTLRLTAGSHSINGGTVQYFKRHGIELRSLSLTCYSPLKAWSSLLTNWSATPATDFERSLRPASQAQDGQP